MLRKKASQVWHTVEVADYLRVMRCQNCSLHCMQWYVYVHVAQGFVLYKFYFVRLLAVL